MTQISFLGELFLYRVNAGLHQLTLLFQCHLICAKVTFLEIQDQAESRYRSVKGAPASCLTNILAVHAEGIGCIVMRQFSADE